MDKGKVVLLFVVGLLAGGAAGYHVRPRLVAYTGGSSDEHAILLKLEQCAGRLAEIQRELNHTQQLLILYQELNEIRKAAVVTDEE